MDTREAVARAICIAEGDDWNREGGELGLMDAYGYLADAAIAAHLKSLADAGMVVVPREPTEAEKLVRAFNESNPSWMPKDPGGR